MGTISVNASGFSTLPASPPASWPAGITWPGAVSPNGSKTYTVSDADWIRIITWTAASQINPAVTPAPSIGQIIVAGFQVWVNGVIQAVAQYFTAPATPGSPPSIV